LVASWRLLPGPPCERSAAGVLVLLDISAVLLVTLISRIDRDVALSTLLVDIALAGFARIRRKIRGRFAFSSGAGTFIAAAGWRDRRQIFFRHCNPHLL
jgi:hypothetical protein